MKGRFTIVVIPILLYLLYLGINYIYPYFCHLYEFKEIFCLNTDYTHFSNNDKDIQLLKAGRLSSFITFIILGISFLFFYSNNNSKIFSLIDSYLSLNKKNRIIAKLKLRGIDIKIIHLNKAGYYIKNRDLFLNNRYPNDKYYLDYSLQHTGNIKPELESLIPLLIKLNE